VPARSGGGSQTASHDTVRMLFDCCFPSPPTFTSWPAFGERRGLMCQRVAAAYPPRKVATCARTQVTEEQLEMVRTFLNDTHLPRDLSRRVLEFSRKQRVKPYDRHQVGAALLQPSTHNSRLPQHENRRPNVQ
jgi:hypothetical protein